MALKEVVKVSRKTYLDPRSWIGYDSLKQQNLNIWSIVKNAFSKEKAEREETFDQAMERLQVTQEEVVEREKDYYFYAWMFVSLAGCTLLLGFYLLFQRSTFTGFLLSLVSSLLFLGQAFRYHFWYFQIKHRTLGCTFDEWRHGKLKTKDAPNAG